MKIIRNSFIFSLIFAFWDAVCAAFPGGLFGGICARIGKWYREGFVCFLAGWDSRLERLWPESGFCRLAKWLLALIPNALSRLYRKSPLFGESRAVAAISRAGEKAPELMGLMLLMLLCVPQQLWNNACSLAAVLGIAALVIFAGGLYPRLRLDPSRAHFWPTLFFITVFLSLFWTGSFSLGLRHVFFALTCWGVLIIITSTADSEERIYSIALCCAVGLCVCGAYALYQRVVGVEADELYTDLELNADMAGRVYSFFENPNAFASLLVYFTPLMFALTVYGKTPLQRLLFGGAFAISLFAMVMTYSRGGWLALFVGGFILALFICPRWIPFFALAALATIPFWPDSIVSRILSIFGGDSSIGSRGIIYASAALLIRQNWLWGVGPGTSSFQSAAESAGLYVNDFDFGHAHNIYMEIWVESGIFALIAFLPAMFFPMRDAARSARRCASPRLRAVTGALLGGVAGGLVFGITDYAWVYPRIMVLFWFAFALLCACGRICKNSERGNENDQEIQA